MLGTKCVLQRTADVLVFSPIDLNHFLECEYLTRLDVEVAGGRILGMRRSPEADFLAAMGQSHEQFHLEEFEREGRNVVRIVDPRAPSGWPAAAQDTERAMVAGADVIYQGVLVDDAWRARRRPPLDVRVEEVAVDGYFEMSKYQVEPTV